MKKQAPFLLVLAIATLSIILSCDPKIEPVDPVEKDTFSVAPESISFKAEDTATKFLTITTNGAWTATPSASWIILDKTAGTGNASLSVSAEANPVDDRTGSITIKGSKSVTVSVTQTGKHIVNVVADPDPFDGNKRSSTTYQLLIYSFADSNGDGVGDFKGIQNKLDYLDGLGVTALWLSPAHPADSYHGYDVTDYNAVNRQYGTEQDFINLINAAHHKGIKIYMDFVLNHSGKGHPWFNEAKDDPSSKYRDYYFFSSNPSSDYKSFPMLRGTSYVGDEWEQVITGTPGLTVTKTDEEVTTGSSDWNLWFWQGSSTGKELRFKDQGDGTMYLVVDINGSCGMLLRRWMNWDPGSKFGASGSGALTEGKTMNLVPDGADISFTGSGRYKIEISNLPKEALYFMGAFGSWMPDLNYGDPSQAESNPCFQDMAASADKWINLGVDGFRLDAVKHICGGINSYNDSANHTLLAKWYEHCNATYKAFGHEDDIFMVGEAWSVHNDGYNPQKSEKNYYKGINSCFEFDYWGVLRTALLGSAGNYVSTVSGFIKDHKGIRQDAITSFFMTNHDKCSKKYVVIDRGDWEEQVHLFRAADDLDRKLPLEQQAAAMILTTPGKPFIYQGEELGYWRTYAPTDSSNPIGEDDEYLRAPIVWDSKANEIAKAGVHNKIDRDMLTGSISVESQSADANSLLNVYRTWSRLRNIYPALAEGTMTVAPGNGGTIAAWYMTADSQKFLVIHNTDSKEAKTATVQDDTSRAVGLLGTATIDHDVLTLGPNSSVVFKL